MLSTICETDSESNNLKVYDLNSTSKMLRDVKELYFKSFP